MNTAAMTPAEVELALAERLSAPCPCTQGEPCAGCAPAKDCHWCAGRGWVPMKMHLEDLVVLSWQLEYGERISFVNLVYGSDAKTSAELLDAAKRALLEALS